MGFNEKHDDFASFDQHICSFLVRLAFFGRKQCLSWAKHFAEKLHQWRSGVILRYFQAPAEAPDLALPHERHLIDRLARLSIKASSIQSLKSLNLHFNHTQYTNPKLIHKQHHQNHHAYPSEEHSLQVHLRHERRQQPRLDPHEPFFLLYPNATSPRPLHINQKTRLGPRSLECIHSIHHGAAPRHPKRLFLLISL